MIDPEKMQLLLSSDYLPLIRFIALTAFGMGMAFSQGLLNGLDWLNHWAGRRK